MYLPSVQELISSTELSYNGLFLQALASLAASSGQFLEERLDRVRTYYECLNLPFEVLICSPGVQFIISML